MLNVCPRTVHRWVARGLITARIRHHGGWCIQFIFLCSDVIEFLDKLPTPRTLDDPKMVKLLAQRRLSIKKARAARGKGKPQGEIVNPRAD